MIYRVLFLLRLLDAFITALHAHDFILEPSTPASQISSSPPIKQAPTKKAKLAERLIRAAVLAHANPTERLRRRRDATTIGSSRQALNFVKETHSAISKGRTATLVDPRRVAPFQSSFSTLEPIRSSVVVDSRKLKPVTKWKSVCHGLSRDSNPPSARTCPSVIRDKHSTRVPLFFVPLQDTETAHTSKRASTESVFVGLCLRCIC